MRSKEIGGDFCDIPVCKENNHLFDDASFFVSGRAAIEYVIKDIKAKKNVHSVALPSWCCDSMIEPFVRNGLDVSFYSVMYLNNGLKVNYDVKTDILLKMNYFGYQLNNPCNFKGIIINDITHCPFAVSEDDYTIGSLRKWAGFATGGFALSKNGFIVEQNSETNEEYVSLRKQAMKQKQDYLSGLCKDKAHLETYQKAELMLDEMDIFKATKEDIEAAQYIDINAISLKRRENAKILLNGVKDKAVFKNIGKNDIPMFVPIFVDDRDSLRKYLISKNIYCPIHWPISNLHCLNSDERYIFEHELSLVCDQRYNIEDMKYILDSIKEYEASKC